VRLEIRSLVRAVRNAADNAAILSDTVELAEENLGIRRVQLEHGLVAPIDVMRTERQLDAGRNQHLDAVIEEQLARARLSLAIGEMPELGGTRS
jgi:outer membrane protein TolC